MSEIKTESPNHFDEEGAFLEIANRLHIEMETDRSERLAEAEANVQAVADQVEQSYQNRQFAIVGTIAAVAFGIGWRAGRR